jgi:amphi-Trp domain-containing protein
MSNIIFKNEEKISRSEASEKIRRIAEGVENGEISLKAGDESIKLTPSDTCEFELEVEEESDGDISLEIEIEWNEKDEQNDLEIG